jgi:hypothetical protein
VWHYFSWALSAKGPLFQKKKVDDRIIGIDM